MASRGRGRRGRPRGTGQAPPAFDQPPVFDQQAFVEAVGIVATAIAQASVAGSQGGPSNLQRFRVHHPPTFTGGGDPMVADRWFMRVEKVLEVETLEEPLYVSSPLGIRTRIGMIYRGCELEISGLYSQWT